MYRKYQLTQYVLQHPRLVLAMSIAFSLAAAVVVAVGSGRSRVAHVTAIGFVLIGFALNVVGGRISRSRRLDAGQRQTLLQTLGRLAPLEVRVSAVNERDAIRYARELRNAMTEARWPVAGVFKCRGDADAAGVTVAVRNVVAPPGEAIALIDTLRRIGIPANWGHKPGLTGDRIIEVRVGGAAVDPAGESVLDDE
jgi:hypothetical protein